MKKVKVLKDITSFQYNRDPNLEIAENFNKLLVDQANNHKRHYLAWKYAEKWKAYIKNKKMLASTSKLKTI